MKQTKKLSRKVISYVLALVMVLSTMTGIVPGMSMTAYAEGTAVDLSTLTGNYTATDGDVLSGTASGKTVTIPAGATVTLNGVNISSGSITCSGNATIILMGSNSVTATDYNAAIKIGGSGTTLTITGSGSLTAKGGKSAAGIGTDRNGSGGNIVINGGTVTATGGNFGAGIGTGLSLSGGTSNTCGAITIGTGVTMVTATKGSNAPNSIGNGKAEYGGTQTCGTITIGGTIYWDGSAYQNGGDTYLATSPLIITHTHSFTYTASGATITATCSEDCDITTGLTLTISAPTGDLTADGTKTFPATLSTDYNTTAFPEGSISEISYAKDGDSTFTGTPTEAGTYTASVTVGEGQGAATASVSYTVNAATQDLADAKTTAKNDLDTLLGEKTEADYDADDWTTLTQAIADGKTAIDNATTTEAVTTAKNNAVDAVNAVKTKAQKALDNAKTSAKADLDTLLGTKTESDYDEADWTTLTQAITDGKTAIDNATTTEAVTTAKNNAVEAVNAVKTKAQKALDNAKTSAKADLDTLLGTKTESDYDEADWTTLTQAITDGKTAIDNATTIEAVTTAKNNAVDAVNAVKTKAQKALDNAKTSAKADLDTLLGTKTESDYDEADWTTLTQAITDGKTAIDNATTTEAVTTAKNNAVETVNAVKTKAQKALDNAKTSAVNTVNAVNANDYIAADQQTVTDAKTTALAAIEAATTEEEVTTALNNFNNAIASCTTQVVADQIAQVMSEVSAKTGSDMTYTGNPIQLINTPTTALPAGYTMKYAVTTENVKPTDEKLYTTEIPTKTEVGTYYVWYKVVGDANHNSTESNSVEAKINPVDKTDLNTAIEEAEAYYESIKDDDVYAQVAEALKKAIDEAKKYTNDNVAEKEVKEAIDTIKVAKVDAEEGKKEADDTVVANEVADAINALPASNKVATTDKAAIEAARKAYDALTADQKKKVPADVLKKLTDAENALKTAQKDAADKTAADKAIEAISKLPASDKVATTDKAAIEAARKAYDALTADQKKKVPADVLKKLTDAEKALKTAEANDKAAKELAAAKEEAQAAMNEQVTVTQKGKKFTVKWKKSSSADGYYVYASYCGKKATKPVKTIKKNTTTKTTITKINGKKVNQKKNFHVYVVPYKVIDGKKVTLGKSTVAHLVGSKNTKYSNVKKLTLTKKKYTVKVGKTAKIKAKVTLVNKNKKHIPKSHGAKFRYKSSDTSIATVDKNGKIKGIKKGTCTIYVYSINGLMKKAKVTIK